MFSKSLSSKGNTNNHHNWRAKHNTDFSIASDIFSIYTINLIKRWLGNYIRGIQTFVEFRNATSPYRRMKQRVPQVSVLSRRSSTFTLADYHPRRQTLTWCPTCTVLASERDTQSALRKCHVVLLIPIERHNKLLSICSLLPFPTHLFPLPKSGRSGWSISSTENTAWNSSEIF